MLHALLICLLGALKAVCSSDYEVCLFKTCFCLAFFGELVSPSGTRLGGLRSNDVIMANGALRLRIRQSKTDIFGHSEWVPLHAVGGSAYPLLAVSEYLKVKATGPIFLPHVDGLPVTGNNLRPYLKNALASWEFLLLILVPIPSALGRRPRRRGRVCPIERSRESAVGSHRAMQVT